MLCPFDKQEMTFEWNVNDERGEWWCCLKCGWTCPINGQEEGKKCA